MAKPTSTAKAATILSLPDPLLCKIADYLNDSFVLGRLCMLNRQFYVAMQLRYESLCIKKGWVKSSTKEGGPHHLGTLSTAEGQQTNQTESDPQESQNFPMILEKNLEERLLDTRNYMSIYGKFMSKCQLVLNMKALRLDPLNLDSVLTAGKKKKRRFSEHQVIDDDDDDDLIVPPQNIFKTYRENTVIREVYTSSFMFRIIAFTDGRHYISKISCPLADLWKKTDEQMYKLTADVKNMIRIPFNNIESISMSQNQFIFTTREGNRPPKLYHGVIEAIHDPDLPQLEALIPEQMGNNAPRIDLENKILKIKKIHGPIQIQLDEAQMQGQETNQNQNLDPNAFAMQAAELRF